MIHTTADNDTGGNPADLTDFEGFEARLSDCARVPPERLPDFLSWPEPRLRREAEVVNEVVARFADAVIAAMERPESAEEFLRELDLKSISRDHDWRAIFSTVRAREGATPEQRRVLLLRYLHYLSFRKRLIDYIYTRRRGLEETDSFSEATLYPHRRLSEDGYERLALGEACEFTVPTSRTLDLRIASHAFRLIGGAAPSLIDENGVTCFLRPGRNMVGRHPESDVRVDADFFDVSRAHLVLEWDGGPTFVCTDLSSRGTFVMRRDGA